MKECSKCRIKKPFSSFSTRKNRPSGLVSECKACASSRSRESELKKKMQDPVAFERTKADRYLRHTYNITIDQYEKMFMEQEGLCAICGQEQQLGIRLCVDHDHSCCPGERSCGKCIRKLLCNRCNTTLGKVNENTTLLNGMINYITSGGEYNRTG